MEPIPPWPMMRFTRYLPRSTSPDLRGIGINDSYLDLHSCADPDGRRWIRLFCAESTQKCVYLLYYTVHRVAIAELSIRGRRGRMKSINADLPILIGQAGPLNGNRWEIEKELLIG